MVSFKKVWAPIAISAFLVSCGQRNVVDQDANSALGGCNPDAIYCKLVNQYANFIVDSFERSDVIDTTNDFGWRKIINDNGKVISGEAGNHVDVQIYSIFEVGPASVGNRAIYNFGRKGASSVHNIYLITKTFDLTQYEGDSVVIQFDYLPVGLEQDEFLKLEICNDTAENCGVGNEITTDGLNSSKWIPVFESFGGGEDLDGLNHAPSDYLTEKVVLFLTEFQKKEFIFRFNSRMNDGFVDNIHTKGMDDGVIIDNVRATAYDLKEGVEDLVDDPEDVLELDEDDFNRL